MKGRVCIGHGIESYGGWNLGTENIQNMAPELLQSSVSQPGIRL